MVSNTDKIASRFLGKKVDGSEAYDKSLLVAVPREENRRIYSIKNDDLPFYGWDVWHAYEFSVMTENGLPVTCLMKLKYNCDNEFLIESKSLNLYLKSFNMSRFGKSRGECLDICKKIIQEDLSEKLKTSVEVSFLKNSVRRVEIFEKYKNLVDLVDESEIVVDKFKESPELLDVENLDSDREYYLTFDSLRSNCRVTHQPDFGDVFIYYKSKRHIKESGLVKYLASFRSEFHFHEECCEMIFKRIFDLLEENDKLSVCALYTRRGGIDISPVRWSKNFEPSEFDELLDVNVLARCGIKQ